MMSVRCVLMQGYNLEIVEMGWDGSHDWGVAMEQSRVFRKIKGINHPSMCWRVNTAGHKQSRKLLECTDSTLLTKL